MPGHTAKAAAVEARPPSAIGDPMHDAQQARLGGNNAAAIGKARAALKTPLTAAQAAQAHEIIGICSCALHDASGAREAASHLSGTRRETIKAECEKKGVSIE